MLQINLLSLKSELDRMEELVAADLSSSHLVSILWSKLVADGLLLVATDILWDKLLLIIFPFEGFALLLHKDSLDAGNFTASIADLSKLGAGGGSSLLSLKLEKLLLKAGKLFKEFSTVLFAEIASLKMSHL